MNSASASSFPVASLGISTCVCAVRDSEREGQTPLSRPSAWQAELSHTISRFVGSTHHCFPIPETQGLRVCVCVCVSPCIWTWTHTQRHTHTSSAINTKEKKKSNINPSTPTWNWKKKSGLTILLLISWKWISQTFSTMSSLSKVMKPNPVQRETKKGGERKKRREWVSGKP